MSDQHQSTGASRKFCREVKPLEPRCLLATTIPHADVIVGHANPGGLAIQDLTKIGALPRGLAFQVGRILHCVVAQPKSNTVQVVDKGAGLVEMSWNFGAFHSFTGVAISVVEAERARTNQFTFQLTHGDTVTAVTPGAGSTLQQSGPSAGSIGIALSGHRAADSVAGRSLALDHQHRGLTVETDSELTVAANTVKAEMKLPPFVNHGLAVQTGSLLTITVNGPRTNIVEIFSKQDPGVEVEWNGGAVHSFKGVTTIIVNTRNASTNEVILADTGA
jgi:hypothetical protein